MKIMLFVVLSLSTIFAYGQKQKKEKSFLTDDERWTLEIPVWVPGFKGSFGDKDVTLKGEDGVLPIIPDDPTQLPEEDNTNIFSRLFNNRSRLRYFFITSMYYQSKRFLVRADVIGGSIGSSVKFNYNNIDLVESSINISLARVYLGYKILEKRSDSGRLRFQLYGYAGARLYFFKVQSSDNKNFTFDISPVWVDPLIGLQFQLDLKNWQFVVATDLGGRSFKNNFSYSSQLTAYYRISKLISVRAGWYDVDIKRNRKVLSRNFSLETRLSGPSLGISFHL
jgi:hypothetical protein